MISRSDRNITWIEKHCFIPDGKYVGQPVRLTDHQKDWLRKLYDTPTRTLIISMPRKNAKTALTSFLLLLHLAGPESVQNGQLYSAAQSREQASILFGYASKSVRMSPTLSQFVTIKESGKELYCAGRGTRYKALSADASTAYGLSPTFIVHDELGQVKGPRSELYDALETASAAHESPLSIIISTQAPTDNDLLSILIDDAMRGTDPARKCVLYTVPLDHPKPFSASALDAANPHWHDFMNQQEVLSVAESARRMPSGESAYRNLHLNQRVEAKDPFVTKSIWDDNGNVPESWVGQKVWGGLDLSEVSDLTALVLVTEKGDVHTFSWLPADGIAEKSRKDRVPYDMWAKDGVMELCPGRSIGYEWIAHRLRQIFDQCDVQAIAFDRYNINYLRPWLEQAGFTEAETNLFKDFGQGFVSMGPAIRTLEEKLLNADFRHGGHPVLSMCAANAVTVSDPANNRKFVKANKSSGRRIDAMVAFAMAVGIKGSGVEDKPKHREFQVMVF